MGAANVDMMQEIVTIFNFPSQTEEILIVGFDKIAQRNCHQATFSLLS